MARPETMKPAADPVPLALDALAWTLGEPARAQRLLDVTGLDAAALRARVADRALLAATLAFLEAHEPDLVACSAMLQVPLEDLVDARRALEL